MNWFCLVLLTEIVQQQSIDCCFFRCFLLFFVVLGYCCFLPLLPMLTVILCVVACVFCSCWLTTVKQMFVCLLLALFVVAGCWYSLSLITVVFVVIVIVVSGSSITKDGKQHTTAT